VEPSVQPSVHIWRGRRRPSGVAGTAVFLLGAAAVLVLMALLAALGLVVMALVGVVMGAERLLASLVPAYRRRRQRYLSMPAGLVRVVRFGARSTQVRFGARSTQVRFGARSTQPIDVRSSESPHGALEP
jgi:hypothetical protein